MARLACERGVNVLGAAFLLALIGVNGGLQACDLACDLASDLACDLASDLACGGLQAFVLYAQRFAGWHTEELGSFVSIFAAIGGTLILSHTLLLP